VEVEAASREGHKRKLSLLIGQRLAVATQTASRECDLCMAYRRPAAAQCHDAGNRRRAGRLRLGLLGVARGILPTAGLAPALSAATCPSSALSALPLTAPASCPGSGPLRGGREAGRKQAGSQDRNSNDWIS